MHRGVHLRNQAVKCGHDRNCEGLKSLKACRIAWRKSASLAALLFYDDSKGTNVSSFAALNGMTVPVILIAGGEGKAQVFHPWPNRFANVQSERLVLIGRCAQLKARLPTRGLPVFMP
jgi:UDP-N-acetylmuramoylalanine--D-glutamate ligase